MSKYIDAEKLIAEIERRKKQDVTFRERSILIDIETAIASLQQEQPAMIQWTGNNLKEVIDFTGKSPRFEEWFKSWEEFETYVHQHNDILKLFCEDGSHYEIPVGAWIVKTPDGYNVPSVSRFIKHEKLVVKSKTCPKCKGTGKILVDESYKDYHTNIRYTDMVEKSCSLCGGKGVIVQQEVDLDSVLTGFMNRYAYENSGEYPSSIDIAHHFYELGLNARKEE